MATLVTGGSDAAVTPVNTGVQLDSRLRGNDGAPTVDSRLRGNDGTRANDAVGPELEYRRFLAEGRFMIQRCVESGRHFFYPRVAAPGTGATRLEWVAACGRGTVYSTTVVRQKPPAPSYNVALIELAEGPRMMSRVVGLPPEEVAIGMAVRARIVVEDGEPLVEFEAA